MIGPKINLAMKVAIPNTLSNGAPGVERLYGLIAAMPPASRYVFDMQEVSFIEPCGVMALLTAARYCTDASGKRVILINIKEDVYLYLDRMNLFTLAGQWLTPLKSGAGRWSRSSYTANLGANHGRRQRRRGGGRREGVQDLRPLPDRGRARQSTLDA